MSVQAFDCTKVKPFPELGEQQARIEVARFFWTSVGLQLIENSEDICHQNLKVRAYDIRGREEEAFWCLKPAASQTVVCDLSFNQIESQVVVIPAIWIRKTPGGEVYRDTHFHAFIAKKSASDRYAFDLFARAQSPDLNPANLILEAAHKEAAPDYRDGYYVNLKLVK